MSQRDVVIAGRYRLLERIGVGGMGSVWRAHDERLERTVAVKLLRLPPGASESEAEMAKDRSMREARITARLHHPHAVPVFDVVEHAGQPCLVMQYLPSRTLQEVLAEKAALPADEVALIGAEVGSALAAAHAAGIVHRDVKPANILITEDGSSKLSDFGISHVLGDARLTSTGMLTGTPAYLAPEVARGESSSTAADVYSLGATLFTAVEGAPPFGTDDNPMALLHRVASEPVPRPTRAGALTPLLLAMLDREPAARPSTAEAAEALQRLDLTAPFNEEPTVPVVAAATQALPERPTESPSPPTVTMASEPDPPSPLPPASNDERPERRSRRGLAIVLALAALAAVAFVAFQALLGDDRTPAASPPVTSTASRSPSPSPTPTTSPATATGPTTTTSEATPSPPRSTTPRATTPSEPPAGPPERVRLVQSLRDYYGLLPDDTDEGYPLLTQRYRSTTAGSQDAYEEFWDQIERVTIRDSIALPPGRVEATLTYTFKDGRVVEERTAYQLVDERGTLKIDSSTVLSSREL